MNQSRTRDPATARPSPEPGTAFSTALALDLPHGRCVAVWLPAQPLEVAAGLGELHEDARAYAEGLAPRRMASWIGGRIALQRAAKQLGLDPGSLLTEDSGAPRIAAGLVGSISHKNQLAAGLAAAEDCWGRGLDLEQLDRPRLHIASRVLTTEEQHELARLPGTERWPALLLRFSLKEALYKALHPWVRRYVGFTEVSMQPLADGDCRVELDLRSGEGPFEVEARWLRSDDLLLSTCRLRPTGARA